MPLLSFLPPDDPRIRATVLTLADELTEDGTEQGRNRHSPGMF